MKKVCMVVLCIFFAFNFSYGNEKNRFDDVPTGHWAEDHIHDLRILNITNGIGNNQFGVGNTISRRDFITFLVRLLNYDLIIPTVGSFKDNENKNDFYYKYIETAVKYGIIVRDTEHFRPNEPITREEMAIMIVRALGYNDLGSKLIYLPNSFEDVSGNIGYINMAKDFGIINGVGKNQFKPYDTATREQAATMMMRMYHLQNNKINELHGFYAISSANQMAFIKDLDSVGFGWSRLEVNTNNNVVLNTSRRNNNEFGIPSGFTVPLDLAYERNVSTHLMVFVREESILVNGQSMPLVDYIVSNKNVRSTVIGQIVKELNSINGNDQYEFDGVVIDFEKMKGEYLAGEFNHFLSELKEILSQYNKKLYVAVHPKRRTGQPYFDGYDYKTIGEIADRVILMAHDYNAKQLSERDMALGYTLTPLTPIEEIYYALMAITNEETGISDRSKIMLQISFDSVQWKLQEGKVINKYPYSPTYESIKNRLIKDVSISYSSINQNPFVNFYDDRDNSYNVLWYEDSRSVKAKIELARLFGVQGLSLWRLGNIPNFEEEYEKEIYLDVWNRIIEYRH
ncbi:S-layer family protein [Natranaerovirga pectinivora]|uniref:S-layer family protein n=1 Tax=Natranaerovirga pectinivora TaxID=682400 RepID=A0A4R3MLS1_9FIRM|nr:S-layer homology domain-containing protein [Natranaerovirga pectinivora]TCT14986.1 S-layer family protein [Natranaerovirga pectinivora]